MKLLLLTLISLSLTVAIIMSAPSDSTLPATAVADSTTVIAPPEHRRPADQTFLTYPEWFLVYSPDEFATFTKTNTPDQFPFFGHVKQFWQAYRSVYRIIKDQYAFNTGYHVMIMVIGTSTTAEYVLRSCYENTIGRLSAFTAGTFTEEDHYATKVAQQYVDFIKITPWYEFNFMQALKGLWKENPATGKNMIRKWERRYILSSEYLVKAGYGWIIKKGTNASYEAPLLVTSVVADKLPAIDLNAYPQIKLVDSLADNRVLLLLPRYDAFKDYTSLLAQSGANFSEIAGNTGSIMITLIVPREWKESDTDKVLFSQPILTNPANKRIALVVPVTELAHTLRKVNQSGLTLEHVYDF